MTDRVHGLDTPSVPPALDQLLRIPSISADRAYAADVRRAVEWVVESIRAAGGTGEIVESQPHALALATLEPSYAGPALDLLIYGHVDVQPTDPVAEWLSPPFEPVVRDGWIYGRGVADMKGQLFMIISAVCELAREGRLSVRATFLCDGEEEIGGDSVVRYLQATDRVYDAAIIFDGRMVRAGVPAFVVQTRGVLGYDVRVRAGTSDLHSGLFGNAALNAVHALVAGLSALLPKEGRLPQELRAGLRAPDEDRRQVWQELTPGDIALASAGAVPYDERAGDEFYLRTTAEPSVDVSGILGGKPGLTNTTIPFEAAANFTVRLGPGQDLEEVGAAVERLLREGTPPNATVEIKRTAAAAPGLVDAASPILRAAADAFERVLGERPRFVSVGGTMPILATLTNAGTPVVLTGFAMNDCNLHAPNERLRYEYLELGRRAARELVLALGGISRDS